ncbi:MAG: hypothetical protein JRI25_02675 [Deltaproteobacteria bacterium]|nr:hypothetical protein [Deltaproteobacteria bacterium]
MTSHPIDGFVDRIKRLAHDIETKAKEEVAALPVPAPSGHETLTNASLLATCQTGDVILWSGSTGVSRVIRFATQSAFSHASIVFRGPLDASEEGTAAATTPRLLQATWSAFHEDADGEHEVVAHEVMLNDLAEVLAGNEREAEPATLRRLQCEDARRAALQADLAAFIAETLGDDYPGADTGSPNLADFIRGLLHLPKRYPNTYFCSELVAAALQAMGVLDTEMTDDAWTPGDLSEKHDALLSRHLVEGYALGAETRVLDG